MAFVCSYCLLGPDINMHVFKMKMKTAWRQSIDNECCGDPTLMLTPRCTFCSSCRVHELCALPRKLRLTHVSRCLTLPDSCRCSLLISKTSSHPVPLHCTRAFVKGTSACRRPEPADQPLLKLAMDAAGVLAGMEPASAAVSGEVDSAAACPRPATPAAGFSTELGSCSSCVAKLLGTGFADRAGARLC